MKDFVRNKFMVMRSSARHNGRIVPPLSVLYKLLYALEDMRCPCCGVGMRFDGTQHSKATSVSLQHDNSGALQFICLRCNAGHGNSSLGDRYFSIPQGEKYFPRCNQNKPRGAFHREGYCKSCRNYREVARRARRRKEKAC